MTEAIETKLFIDGEYCTASDKGTYEIYNPARPAELVGRAASGTPADVERAMQAAHAAFPAWAALSYSERADKLRIVAAAITQDMEEVEARASLSRVSTAKSCLKLDWKSIALASAFCNAPTTATDLNRKR